MFRHHRKLRHKYAETLNRRLSWDNHPYADDAKRMLKSTIRGCWRHDLWPAARHVNTDARHKTPDNPTGIRPGQNIEDAERGAMEHLLFGDWSSEEWPSTFHKTRGRGRKQHRSAPESSSALAETQTGQVEYTIDPITNRKMPKAPKIPTGADIPATGLKGYQPQFTQFSPPPLSDSQEPIFYDGPPPEAELKKYGPVKLDTHASEAAYDDQPNPVFESEEYESNHATSSKKTVFWHSNDGILSTTSNISNIEGDNVDGWTTKPGNFGYEQHLDKYTDSTPAHKQRYDDLHKYKPVISQDEDGEITQSSQQYPDLTGYNTYGFRYLEPDGKPAVEEQAESASEVDEYQPFQLSEEDARAVYDEPQAHPAELSNYRPFGYNEPDGKPAFAVAESNDYDPEEVQQYQAFRYNEPDGKPELVTEEGNNYDVAEVQGYQAFRYNEPDGKPASAENAEGYDRTGLQEYQEISLSERDEDSFTAGGYDVNELEQYGTMKHNEPDGKPAEQVDSAARALDEFDREQKTGQRVPYLEPTEEERAEDLDLLRASDIRASFSAMPAAELEPNSQTRDSLESSMSDHAVTSDAADQEVAEAVSEAKRRSLETEDRALEQGRQLTGNYVRDFPEEFARSWSSTFTHEQSASRSSSTEVPLVQPALNRQAKLAPKPAVGDLFSKEPQGLETSYEKECAATLGSPIFVKEYGSADAQAKSADAVTPETSTSSSETASQEAAAEPTLYKILAYDQTMQTINIAETSSRVSKTEPPLTPAEVLLRLSNPAKFFPHFGPLQAQGFEIVSGSGDVLVFRKVRDAESAVSRHEPTPASIRDTVSQTPLVNPIDMTGSRPRKFPDPAIGRFASPTGFVNYDMPAAMHMHVQQGADPVKRFVSSGIGVRREEPVFSGGERKGEGEEGRGEKKKKKASLPKRMAIGAAWVAGVSYALGVTGEYFKTGGADGLGPKGF